MSIQEFFSHKHYDYFEQTAMIESTRIGLLLAVFVEPLPRLHAELALGHHLVYELAGSPQGELRVVVDVFVEVDAGVVQQLEGAHGVAQAQLDRHVHVLVAGVPSLYHRDGILENR